MVLNCLYSFLGDIIFLFKSFVCFCACVYAYMAGVNIWCSLYVFQLCGLVYFFSRTVRNIYVLRKLFLCQPYSLQIFIPSFITQFVFWLGLFNCAAIPFREEFIDPAVAGSAVIWQSSAHRLPQLHLVCSLPDKPFSNSHIHSWIQVEV